MADSPLTPEQQRLADQLQAALEKEDGKNAMKGLEAVMNMVEGSGTVDPEKLKRAKEALDWNKKNK